MILGVVLAGGRSSRFGSNKADALLAGRSLVEHARAQLAAHVATTLIVGGAAGDIADLPRPGLGPLGGIAGALDRAASLGYVSVLTIACDMPRVPDALIAELAKRAPAYCADAPVLGHWPTAAGAQLIADMAASDDHSVRRWARAIGAVEVATASPLPNVNTPADLAAL
ncbi:molybdenum cofactor guanylyltransferase [Sphingomonas sp. PB2P19]|uniref:molybdenum cofactor guanylyltransferase n=1 Tax=Sphingomonas rhamnosi TaxID=3096156 RepID=UPI002FC86411